VRVEVERIRRVAFVISVLVLCGTASADPADTAFARGREMLKVGKYQQACDAFEESHRLRPRADAQFNIALCSEQLGKLATAMALHRELASTLDTPARRAKSAELAAQLEPRVPRLKIIVGEARKRTPRAPEGLEVRVNGEKVTDLTNHPIDLGTSSVAAIAPGFLDWSGEVAAAQEGEAVSITIGLRRDPDARPGEGGAEEPDVPVDPAPVETPADSNRKAYAVVTFALGGVALAGGVTFGLLAQSSWNSALDTCGGDEICVGSEAPRGNHLFDQAKLRGNVSTGLFIVSGVAVVGGIVLWISAPSSKKSVAIAPAVDESSTGFVVYGRF